MNVATILVLILITGFVVALLVWRPLRLRHALFAFREQIAWSIRHAPRGKFVLEVGSGNNPHLRANVLCEKYLYDDVHRGGGVALDRPLVAGDASALPFRTGVFDVIISSHLIEHLEDPRSFFQEAGRVADGGLFIAPSTVAEQLRGTPAHLWLIEQKGNVLHFTPKSRPICFPVIHKFFANEVWSSSLKMNNFRLDHWKPLIITYIWTGQPECVVEGEPFTSGFVQASTVAATATVRHNLIGVERLRDYLKRWVRNAAHALLCSNHKIDWAEILACPRCHGSVSVSTSDVYCPACELCFPIDRGIPIMLLDHAITSPRSELGVYVDTR